MTQISVGRMIYDPCRQRGRVDRSWKLQKLSFHRNSRYEVVKKRCVELTWPDDDEDSTFYVSDGSGISVEKEKFEIVAEDGSKRYVAWTLSNYLEVSHIKYPSRARLYCVKIAKGKGKTKCYVHTCFSFAFFYDTEEQEISESQAKDNDQINEKCEKEKSDKNVDKTVISGGLQLQLDIFSLPMIACP